MRKIIIVWAFALVTTACGTTSGIRQSDTTAGALVLDFSSYNSVLVTDFKDGTENRSVPEDVGSDFAERIVGAIRGKEVFDIVTEDPSEISDRAIVIGGDITRYAKGNAALKLLVGFGAGSTFFDSNVVVSDFTSQEQLGVIVVDRNSWALGGLVAASQSVSDFMNDAAEKIAVELVNAKN